MTQQATEPPGAPDKLPGDRALRSAAIVFAVGLALHTADHVRRGVGVLTPEVLWGGTVLTLVGVVAIAAVLARHRLAPKVAVVVGFYTAVAVATTHLLPHWSSLSDAFPGSGVGWLSWAAVSVEIAGARPCSARRRPSRSGAGTRRRSRPGWEADHGAAFVTRARTPDQAGSRWSSACSAARTSWRSLK